MKKLVLVIKYLFGVVDQSNTLMYLMLAEELGVRSSGDVKLNTLDLTDSAKQAFEFNEIYTVQQAILALCLSNNLPRIGDKTWDALLNIVAN